MLPFQFLSADAKLANEFGQFITESIAFELLAPVRLNIVCFTLAGAENPNKVYDSLEELNKTGQVFMTPTMYQKQKGIRAAFVNWRTTGEDVQQVIELMNTLYYKLSNTI